MRILFATDLYLPTPGGVSVVTDRLTQALLSRGHTVGIIAPSTSWRFYKEVQNGVTVYRIPSILIDKAKKLLYSPKFINGKIIERIVDTFKPDIIHIETPDAIASTTVNVAKKHNLPLIATSHIMQQNISSFFFLPPQVSKLLGFLYMKLVRQVFNNADVVTTPSATGRKVLQSTEVVVPAQVISNGIDLQQFKTPSSTQQQALRKKYHLSSVPIILYVGRLDREKKVKVLIEAAALLKDTMPFQLIISGTGQQISFLQTLTKKLQVEDKVIFLGYATDEDILVLYSIASLFVMASTAELQCVAIMEAMAMGLPIIGARAGAIPYLVIPEKNGLLFEPDDPEDLAKKIQQVLSDAKMRQKMGDQSKILIKKHDIRTVVKEMESLYKRVITTRSVGKPQFI